MGATPEATLDLVRRGILEGTNDTGRLLVRPAIVTIVGVVEHR